MLEDKRTDVFEPKTDDLCYEGGIREYVEYLRQGIKKDPISDIIYLSGTKGDSTAEIALMWSTAYDNKIMSFANRDSFGSSFPIGCFICFLAFYKI